MAAKSPNSLAELLAESSNSIGSMGWDGKNESSDTVGAEPDPGSSKLKRKSRSKILWKVAKRKRQDEESAAGPSYPQRFPPAPPTDFERYYAIQQVLPWHEWKLCLGTLRRPLPVTFRVNASVAIPVDPVHGLPHADEWIKHGLEPPWQLGWGGAWQIGCDRNALADRWGPPVVKAANRWLGRRSASGHISRQELASMVPAELLGVQRHHMVADMCAAPGSKTIQLLDTMGSTKGAPAAHEPCTPGAGLVLANDMDLQRCWLLTARLKGIGNAAANAVVTCHSAHRLPNVTTVEGEYERYPEGPYDRIICDVPCSGDGTLRKDPKVWKQWHPMFGIKLHTIQLQIALRAAALLKVGGLMVYSTCSFNPIEDEAVVAALLDKLGGALELVNTKSALPGLERAEGISWWRVIDDQMRVYDSFDQVPPEERHAFQQSMWPPKPATSWAGAQPPPLNYCMRLYPHLSDTGGFFVALLRKKCPIPGPKLRVCQQPKEPKGKEQQGGRYGSWHGVGSAARDVANAHGLQSATLKSVQGALFSRSESVNNVVWLPPTVHEHVFDGEEPLLNLVHAGITLFSNSGKQGALEPTTEASTGMLLPHWDPSRLCELPNNELLLLLQQVLCASEKFAKEVEFKLPRKQVAQAVELPTKGPCVLWAQVTSAGRVAIAGKLSKKQIKLKMTSNHLHACIDSIEAQICV